MPRRLNIVIIATPDRFTGGLRAGRDAAPEFTRTLQQRKPNPMIKFLKSIPAQWRRYVYTAVVIATVSIGAVQVWCLAVPDTSVPGWTIRALAVLAYIGATTNLSAAVNAGNPGPPPVPDDNEPPQL